MFRRTFWFTAGAVTGVWATTKAQRFVRGLTPESLAATAVNRAIDAGFRAKLFAEDVRDAMAEREAQLNDALGLESGPRHELPGQRLKSLPASEAAPRRRQRRAPARGLPAAGASPNRPYRTYDRKEDL
ncbi:DUF6167 family protein [Streptomyces polyrhachis]|uniref:DUF6167 family protein n=1 Tax=Streptomyces polyrhachis TaxID=1282885 RepID=A0ABW2GEF7_9ACTN